MQFYTGNAPARKGAKFTLESPGLAKGQALLGVPANLSGQCSDMLFGALPRLFLPPELFLNTLATGPLPVGGVLTLDERPVLAVSSRFYLPLDGDAHSMPALSLAALDDLPPGTLELVPQTGGPALAWVTVSDKGAVGAREDASGPAVAGMAGAALSLRCSNGYVVPDEVHRLRSLVLDLALTQGYDLIITSGGTGLTPRDITPEALLPLVEKRLHGLEQAMLQASLAVTPRGALSRPVCGSIGSSLLVTLPGSLKAVRENLAAVLGALGHGLEKLQGCASDCGRH